MALPTIPPEAHWRDSARQARFFGIDARATFLLLIFLLHIRLWTFIISLISILFFIVIERFGFTYPIFFRWLRNLIAGPRKLAIPWWKQ